MEVRNHITQIKFITGKVMQNKLYIFGEKEENVFTVKGDPDIALRKTLVPFSEDGFTELLGLDFEAILDCLYLDCEENVLEHIEGDYIGYCQGHGFFEDDYYFEEFLAEGRAFVLSKLDHLSKK